MESIESLRGNLAELKAQIAEQDARISAVENRRADSPEEYGRIRNEVGHLRQQREVTLSRERSAQAALDNLEEITAHDAAHKDARQRELETGATVRELHDQLKALDAEQLLWRQRREKTFHTFTVALEAAARTKSRLAEFEKPPAPQLLAS